MTALIAFHGKKSLKKGMLRELDWHAEQDKIIKGSYGDLCKNGDFKGCAIGCSIHSLARIQKRKLNTADHRIFETELGIPVEIAHFVDGLFEALPDEDARQLPKRVIEAIRPGADLSMVITQFLYWMLSNPEDGSITDAREPDTKAFVNAVIALFDEWVRTRQRPAYDSPHARDVWAAWNARHAWAARDAWDAWAARDAWDAWAAWNARHAWAARDAWAAWAAWNARDAWAARDAWNARNKRAANKLIELLKAA